MIRPARRRRGESGQGFWEWMVVGGVLLGVVTVVGGLTGGYLAATYDQHHSRTPLSAAAPAPTPTPEPPSVVFVQFSPVGLYEGCIREAAAKKGLTWDGGELGWSAASLPRPDHSDPNYTGKLIDWRNKMTALVGSVAGSADWQACLKPQLTPPPERTQEPTETIAVDGTYDVDPASVQAIGGCGSTNPTSLTVSGNGSAATVFFQSQTFAMQGSMDASSYAIDVQSQDSKGTKHELRGSFSSNAGVTRFTGEYEVTDQTAGCGYQFTAQKR